MGFHVGYKNNFITYGLLAFLLAIFQIVRGGNIWRSFALILSMLVSITMVSNATGIAGCAVILIFLLLRLYKYNRICNIVSYSIITVLFFVGVVLLRLQDKLSFVIQNLLNRDLTFSARTFIWDDAIKLIQASPVTGYGILTEEGVFHVLNKMWTHNQILGILFEGGAVGLLLFLIILFIAFRELFLLRNNIYSQILSLFIFVLMIMSQFEYYTTAPMLLFIIFACHIRCFGEQLLTKEEKQQGLQEMNVDCYEIKWESVRDIFKKTWWVIVLSAVLGTVGGCVKAMIESGGGLISIQNHYWTIIKFSGAVTLLAILIVWVICYRKNSRIIKA